MAIEHSASCEQRLLGLVALAFGPDVTFTLRNLQTNAELARQRGLAPKCECGRLALAKLNTEINRVRAAGQPVDHLLELRKILRKDVLAESVMRAFLPDEDRGGQE